MKTGIKKSFDSDVKKIRDKKLLLQVEQAIKEVEDSKSLFDVKNFKKLKGYKNYYRIRIHDYRIGIFYEKEEVVFVRFLHCRDIYKHFPPQ
ncbi:MAG: type II toxin-antitoxin system RelE/ParE family toxin [Chitinophagales bacterium]